MITVPDEIKDLLHLDHCQKNIRIHFPNGERSDICNDLIVMDSVRFTESLCSQNELKFGLCESPVFECEVVGVGNIKGATIEVFCEIFCSPTVSGAIFQPDIQQYVYQISYGTFVISEAKRQADMIHRKIQSYGGLAANFDNENEILKMKNDMRFPEDPRDYNPDIFKTCMMLSGATGLIPGATYEPVLGSVNFLIASKAGLSYTRFDFRCICYEISPNNEDDLFYLDYGKPTKTKDEIIKEFFPDGSGTLYDEVSAFIKKLRMEGCGILNRQLATLIDSSSNNFVVAMQSGKYIYPYQAIMTVENQMPFDMQPGYIIIPESIVRRETFDQSTSTKEVVFNTGQIYRTILSNAPTERKAFLRDIVSTITDRYGDTYTVYSYDSTKIDYLELMNASMELEGRFGNMNRAGYFDTINIKQQFGLTPSQTLYPNTDTYPQMVTGGKLLPEDYQTCWYDDEYTMRYGAVKCIYKDLDAQDAEYIYYLPGYDENTDPYSYKTYNLDKNAIMDGVLYTEQQIAAICAVIANNIDGVTYMPVDFVGRGLPYVEAGDTFEILTKSNDSITTIVLNRTLTGEQTLTDSYKSV